MTRMARSRNVPGRDVVPTAVRPRYRRIVAALGAFVVTLVTALGGLGVLPAQQADAAPGVTLPGSPAPEPGAPGLSAALTSATARATKVVAKLPAHSGTGRRVVFDMRRQRVWLVDVVRGRDVVRRTYLASGSVTDYLSAGTYAVYSTSLHAVGVADSGTMRYMVRFTRGRNAAIGFHDIPVSHGVKVQSRSELGTPRSHGCIRQWRPDAKALWDFAPVGTRVVVV